MTTVARLERAFEQRLYLIEPPAEVGRCHVYHIQGSGNRSYCVTIDKNPFATTPTCECPDYCSRGYMCKHICFVLLVVLRLPADSLYLTCLNLSQADIQRVSSRFRPPAPVRQRPPEPQQKSVPQKPYAGLACAICFEDLDESAEQLVYCERSCGQSVHGACQQRWLLNNESCVYCRSKWWSS